MLATIFSGTKCWVRNIHTHKISLKLSAANTNGILPKVISMGNSQEPQPYTLIQLEQKCLYHCHLEDCLPQKAHPHRV